MGEATEKRYYMECRAIEENNEKEMPQKNDKEETQKGRDSIKDEKDWIPEEETKRHFKLKR